MGSLTSPPSYFQRARLSDDFGHRFLLFIDTEEEFDWGRPFSRDVTATTATAALPEAHKRFGDWGIRPTYLADYPVVTDPRSADILSAFVESGSGSVGAQLHPWVTPPFSEAVSDFNSYPGNLPRELERQKIETLTHAIETYIGIRPTIYRAGRYGVGPNTAGLLCEAGYRLDVSTRPLFDYRKAQGPDFRAFPIWPWWVDRPGGLLELPLTVGWTGWGRKAGLRLYTMGGGIPFGRGILARSGALQRIALTPEGVPFPNALNAFQILLDEGTTIFSLSFHSPSLLPGHTPYVRDAADLKAFWKWWDGVISFFAKNGVLPASSDQFLTAVQR